MTYVCQLMVWCCNESYPPCLPPPPPPSTPVPPPLTYPQQQDLLRLGELLLCVSLQSSTAAQPSNFHASMEQLASKYSHDLQHIIQ